MELIRWADAARRSLAEMTNGGPIRLDATTLRAHAFYGDEAAKRFLWAVSLAYSTAYPIQSFAQAHREGFTVDDVRIIFRDGKWGREEPKPAVDPLLARVESLAAACGWNRAERVDAIAFLADYGAKLTKENDYMRAILKQSADAYAQVKR